MPPSALKVTVLAMRRRSLSLGGLIPLPRQAAAVLRERVLLSTLIDAHRRTEDKRPSAICRTDARAFLLRWGMHTQMKGGTEGRYT